MKIQLTNLVLTLQGHFHGLEFKTATALAKAVIGGRFEINATNKWVVPLPHGITLDDTLLPVILKDVRVAPVVIVDDIIELPGDAPNELYHIITQMYDNTGLDIKEIDLPKTIIIERLIDKQATEMPFIAIEEHFRTKLERGIQEAVHREHNRAVEHQVAANNCFARALNLQSHI